MKYTRVSMYYIFTNVLHFLNIRYHKLIELKFCFVKNTDDTRYDYLYVLLYICSKKIIKIHLR